MRSTPQHRALLCIDNIPGLAVLQHLIEDPSTEVVGTIVHPVENALNYHEIKALCIENAIPIVSITEARKHFSELIEPLAPDYLISIYFDYILDDRFIDLATVDAINLHPGYLPYNKGFYYYAWAILDGTPAGVSIHRIVSEVDAGPVISQKRVVTEITDTGESLYQKHLDASIELFIVTWPNLKNKSYHLFSQPHKGTRKLIADTLLTTQINPYKKYEAKYLINLLRVFSFNQEGGCTIELDGKIYTINLELEEVSHLKNNIKGKTDQVKFSTNCT